MNNFKYKLISPGVIEKTPSAELDLRKDYVLVKPKFLSICAADIRYFFGLRNPKILNEKLPLCLIHEGVGTVTLSNSNKYKKGDHVILLPNIPLNNIHCKNENYLSTSKFMSSSCDGFMQENILMHESNLLLINKKFNNLEVMSLCEILSVVIHAIESNKEKFLKAKKIALFGDGNLSYLAHLYLMYKYPNKDIYIYGVNEKKLNLFSKKINVINSLKNDIEKDFDIAIEMVGGEKSEDVIDNIINYINANGTIILLGVSENKININTRLILEKGLTIIGRSRSQPDDFIKARNFIYKEHKNINKIITQVFTVKNTDDMVEAFNKSRITPFKTIMKWEV